MVVTFIIVLDGTGCLINTLPKKNSYNFQTFIHKTKNRGSFGNQDIGILHEQAIF